MQNDLADRYPPPAEKRRLSRTGRLLRLIASTFDIRAWLHLAKLLNYYNYSHVVPLRKIQKGGTLSVSPDVVFSNPARIEIGSRVNIGSRCHIWAGPSHGRIIVGDDVLFGPEVMLTAASYRFNDGHPVTKQRMDEADIVIGNDVWFGTRAIVLPGVTIGDGAIIGACAVVRSDIPAMAIAVGQPARIVGMRKISSKREKLMVPPASKSDS
ncbi:acyltransferase [Sphingomonas sp. ASY06-1R]|uniref:acyltransferase n=1 Tax=Sphingomonas sp. ASY06-1R TaxID=3445771 RepID=UPI003FA2D875